MKNSMTANRSRRGRTRGFLEMDMAVAMALLAVAIVPVGYSFAHERQLLRAEYYRSVAVELVDGEAEILAAGAGKDLPEGTQPYTVPAGFTDSLPPGAFQLTKNGPHVRLEWIPSGHQGVGSVTREFNVK